MKYEEALRTVTSLCENWKTTHSNYKLEEAVFKTDVNSLHARVQALFDNIFPVLSEGNIRVERGHVTDVSDRNPAAIQSNTLEVRLFNGECTTYGYRCVVYWESIAKMDKETFVDNLMRFLIDRTCNYAQVRISDINLQTMSKLYGYMRLIELDVKQSSLYEDLLTEIAKEKEIVKCRAEVVAGYKKWCDEVTKAIEDAGNAWLEQGPEIVPGMKIAILDLRNRRRVTKIVRSTSKRSAEPIVRFTDGSFIYTNNGRIDAVGTWLLQHEEFKEVADTCELSFR